MEGLEDPQIAELEGSGDDDSVCLSDSSEDQSDTSVSDQEDDQAAAIEGLSVSEDDVARNYELLGGSLPADPPLHLLEDLRQKYPFAFTELSESTLATVLQENPLEFELSAFQVHSINQEII